ncbi:MAG: hypothetical protein ACR2JK_15785 [Geodermatophilaceae bacterium]
MRDRTAGPRPRCYGRLIPSFLLAAVLVLVACGARPVATPPVADSGPDRPGAGGAALVVDGQALGAPVVLDPVPSGLGVWGVRYNPSDDGYPPQRATLYGDPSFADTLDRAMMPSRRACGRRPAWCSRFKPAAAQSRTESLRIGTAAELEAMRLASITREPKPHEVGCPPGALIVSAIVDDYRWAFGVGVDPDYPDEGAQSCSALITVDPSDGAGSGSFALPPLGQLSGVMSWTNGPPGHPAGTTVGGVAPPGTDRVTILGPDGVSVDAVLSVNGPRPGERLFGQFFPGSSAGVDGPYAITAFDAADTVLATLTL